MLRFGRCGRRATASASVSIADVPLARHWLRGVQKFLSFHWHGETFDLQAHAVHLARSEGCDNQAFCICERVLGLQFHLEVTRVTAKSLTEQCQSDLVPGRYIQSATEMLSVPSRFTHINTVMDALLDYWENLELKKVDV